MSNSAFTPEQRLHFAKERRATSPEFLKPFIHPTVFPDGIPDHVTIGENPYLGKNVSIGGPGFGFAWDPDNNELIHIAQEGGVIIGDNVMLLEMTNVHRATMKGTNTVIGNGSKLDTLIHIGHNTKIGENCIIASGVTVAGSCVLGDRVIVWSRACIGDHVNIADGVIVGAGAFVLKDITDPFTVWWGNPARKLRKRGADEF